MFDSQADTVVAVGFVAAVLATGFSLRIRIDVRSVRDALGDLAVVAAVAAGVLVGSTVATMLAFIVLWFTFTPSWVGGGVSPLLFATWLVVFFVSGRETVRGLLYLMRPSCAPTGAEAP